MPLLPFVSTDIVVDLTNISLNGVSYKRKVTINTFSFERADKKLSLICTLKYYTMNNILVDDTVITLLTPIGRAIITDNTFVVDATTGQRICKYTDIGNDMLPISPCFGKNYLKEFDFYDYVATTHPIILNQILVQVLNNNVEQFN
jgi:hypothetical protein